jgi:hypothetical protein
MKAKRPDKQQLSRLYLKGFLRKPIELILQKSIEKFPPQTDTFRIFSARLSNLYCNQMFHQEYFLTIRDNFNKLSSSNDQYISPEISKSIEHLVETVRNKRIKYFVLDLVDSKFSPREVELILHFIINPKTLDASWPGYLGKYSKRKFELNKEQLRETDRNARLWAKMFSEKPSAMIYALPKIMRQVEKFYQNPLRSVVLYFLQMNTAEYTSYRPAGLEEWIRNLKSPAEFCDRFFSVKASVIRDELKVALQIPQITTRTIEDARKEVRRLCFPQNDNKKTEVKF